jgi:site-specific DNA-methyltransferase (adenine-specific)
MMGDDVRLMLGDCLERMGEIEDGSVDLILCDLPYGTTACAWDVVIPFEPLWTHYRRVLKPYCPVVLNSGQPFTTDLINSNRPWFKYCWIWVKTKPGDIFNAKNKPLRTHEDICVFSPGTTANGSDRRMPYYPQGTEASSIVQPNKETVRAFYAPRPSHKPEYIQETANYPRSILEFPSEYGFHRTQKPVPLMEYLIRTYSGPGDTVLDNCMGSGTTGVACRRTWRNFIGIERDPAYFEIASKRIADEDRPMFDGPTAVQDRPAARQAPTLFDLTA